MRDTPETEPIQDITTPETEQDHPRIIVNFGNGANDISIEMKDISPYMMWGAAKMIERYANDLWDQNQFRQFQEDQKAQAGGLEIARILPSDHLPKRNGRRN